MSSQILCAYENLLEKFNLKNYTLPSIFCPTHVLIITDKSVPLKNISAWVL